MSDDAPTWPKGVLQQELFDYRSGGRGRRLTQDSPILPNVWLAFAKDPMAQQDLLISPMRGEPAGTVVRELRNLIEYLAEKENLRWGDKPSRIAHVPGLIVGSLYFNELMRLVLFSTVWWRRRAEDLSEALDLVDAEGKPLKDSEGNPIDLSFPLEGPVMDRVITWIAEEWPESSNDWKTGLPPARDGVPEPPYDFLKLIRIVGMIAVAYADAKLHEEKKEKEKEKDSEAAKPERDWRALTAEQMVEAFNEVFRDFPAKVSPSENTIWGVTLNRKAEPMITQSVKSMKADAGRHLFNISCSDIRWAVIDSGIDAHHPAFSDWRARDHGLLPRSHRPRPSLRTWDGRPSRVIRTYDFASLRDLLDPEFLARLKDYYVGLRDEKQLELKAFLQGELRDGNGDAGQQLKRVALRLVETAEANISPVDLKLSDKSPEELRLEAMKKAEDLIHSLIVRINQGFEIDWATIEPLIEDVTPDKPKLPHGTQVAGVLGANWHSLTAEGRARQAEEAAEDEKERQAAQERAEAAAKPGEDNTRTAEEAAEEKEADEEAKFDAGPGPDYALKMSGVCDDIELVDLRVVTEVDGEVAPYDFEVISALKFIGYLNSRADQLYVHGANLSVAIPHDVRSFACGRTPVCEECEALVNSGVCVVVAAGNGGYYEAESFADRFYRPGSIADPGNAESVITVGATHRQHPHEYGVSFFSSRGPTGDGRRKPDLVAPGEKISTPSPGRRVAVVDGTSFAAPHVSGAAAMLMARYSEMIGQPLRIKQILCSTATDLGRERDYQGHGMLDVLRALQSL